ncbi:hypothetical protein OIU34_16575 [Pararhizobium sp. BT-229]|uniref:hypothetical protein n=1 Tax=Pararhizobium sp. BT-229 TaxID=2986923 RepID=UPI0021F6E836|nr:hypothetical protein [Pararhizobium sp. BT-229]MCV9963519.1 hypothetical protein [Pararhizobium sp. BT-229]
MLDLFLPTNPTGLFGFLTVLSLIGFFVGWAMIRLDSVGHLVVGCSAIGLMFFGPTFGLFAMSDAKQNEFLEMKAALTPVHQRVFDKSCTQLGAVTDGVNEKNCYDLDIYRVWSVGDRYYIGMVNGDRADIAVIFDRDGMIANQIDSVVFVSPAMDLHRISYAFERVS